jgi:hypothetical protein
MMIITYDHHIFVVQATGVCFFSRNEGFFLFCSSELLNCAASRNSSVLSLNSLSHRLCIRSLFPDSEARESLGEGFAVPKMKMAGKRMSLAAFR